MGRPKGSKNRVKKKQPQPPPPLTSEMTIPISPGENIVQRLLRFCCHHQVSVTVLNASGQLANIIPDFPPNGNIPAPLPIESLLGAVVPTPSPLSASTNSQETTFHFAVSFSSSAGAIVMRSATAASTVNVVVKLVMMQAPTSSNVPPQTCNRWMVEDPIELSDQAKASEIETTPARDVPPQTQNLSFDDLERFLMEDSPVSEVPPQDLNLYYDELFRLVMGDPIESSDRAKTSKIETILASDVPPQTQSFNR